MSPCYDLILLHAPAIYDFRKINYIFSPYLIRNYDVQVTDMQEMAPLGMGAAERYLSERGLGVKRYNIARLMLEDPGFSARRFLCSLKARLFGIDLQWLVHAQGALALAEELKGAHPRTPIVFGGLSATYYHRELIGYPQVDFVLRGYDTLSPLYRLVLSVRGKKRFDNIANLTFKTGNGSVRVNRLSYVPDEIRYKVNWSGDKSVSGARRPNINLMLGAGCEYNCGWCGGSSYFYRRVMGRGAGKTRIGRNIKDISGELRSLKGLDNPSVYSHGYGYEDRGLLDAIVKNSGGVAKAHFEVFNLLKKETVGMIRKYIRSPVFVLTLGSHDRRIRRICGRSGFGNPELERWIAMVLGSGSEVRIWFYIGLPRQTPDSVAATADYCVHLMEKFRDPRIYTLIQPLLRLEPGSRFYDEPRKFGYRLLYRSLEEHRKAAVSFPWGGNFNYESSWISREKMVTEFYAALRKILGARHRLGFLPGSLMKKIGKSIDNSVKMISMINIALKKGDEKTLKEIRGRIAEYNRRHIRGDESVLFPLSRELGGKGPGQAGYGK